MNISVRYTPSLVILASVAALVAGPVDAQNTLPGYAPGSARYRVVTTISASQVMMGQTQESGSKSEEVNSIVITKSGDGLTQTMMLDSVSLTRDPPMPGPDVNAMLGLKYTGTMGLDGKVTTSTVTDKSGAAANAEFASQMRSFLPKLKPGATVGATWSDSSTTVRKQNGTDVTNTLLSNFTFAGDTTVAGARAWKIAVTSTGKLSGRGSQQGADFTIAGTVDGRGTIVVSTAGVLLGAHLASDASMIADVPMASMQIPITQKQTTTIVKLP